MGDIRAQALRAGSAGKPRDRGREATRRRSPGRLASVVASVDLSLPSDGEQLAPWRDRPEIVRSSQPTQRPGRGRVGVRPYDFLGPLFRGEAGAELDLELVPRHRVAGMMDDRTLDVGEMSLSRYVALRSNGDQEFVALPAFVYRGFRHRSFYVPDDSSLTSLSDLAGRVVGADRWSDTGMVWSRAILDDAGVDLGSVEWVTGPYRGEELQTVRKLAPAGARVFDVGQSVLGRLCNHDVDVVILSRTPDRLYPTAAEPAPIRRLIVDYAAEEQAYARNAGVFPIHHVLVARRPWLLRHPEEAAALFRALSASWRAWFASLVDFSEPDLPWGMRAVDIIAAAPDRWMPQFGAITQIDTRTLEVFCDAMTSQGLIAVPVDPSGLFS